MIKSTLNQLQSSNPFGTISATKDHHNNDVRAHIKSQNDCLGGVDGTSSKSLTSYCRQQQKLIHTYRRSIAEEKVKKKKISTQNMRNDKFKSITKLHPITIVSSLLLSMVAVKSEFSSSLFATYRARCSTELRSK